ncbi:MAG TPA: hypothetical protein VMH37_18655 [Candidatus Binataceae bacterium]|nr:hypothetical protein [Candidatus Binataceae bacterium]
MFVTGTITAPTGTPPIMPLGPPGTPGPFGPLVAGELALLVGSVLVAESEFVAVDLPVLTGPDMPEKKLDTLSEPIWN